MTKLLERAIEAACALPSEMQDEIAAVVLQQAGEELPVVEPNAEEKAALEESLKQAARGEFVTDERCAPPGRSTACESALYTPGACRPRNDPRLCG